MGSEQGGRCLVAGDPPRPSSCSRLVGAPTDGGRTEGCSHGDPRAGAAAASRGLPSQPLLRGRLGAGGRGPSGVPLGTRPGPAARASRSPHRAQAGAPAVPGPCRGPRSVEPSQCGLCQDSRGGVGAAGTQPSACSCSGSSGSAEPLPFLGKVELGLPHGRPAGRRLTCQEEEGTESHPSCSQSSHLQLFQLCSLPWTLYFK